MTHHHYVVTITYSYNIPANCTSERTTEKWVMVVGYHEADKYARLHFQLLNKFEMDPANGFKMTIDNIEVVKINEICLRL
ncbi:MAG: hypothetical protein MN733_05300 [Nitrososphaera sp.]|nr:hypothetical protein [Nitrososphaera sp.]